MHQLAAERGGKCLSKKYKDSHRKLRWQCTKGHVWESAPKNIKSGCWCPHCAGKLPLGIELMRAIAKALGGECLSPTYKNASTKLLWRCVKGHIWLAAPAKIQQGHWCHVCANKNKGQWRKLDIALMRSLAEKRGGQCLSTHYTNNRTKLKWRCIEGHTWWTTPSSIKNKETWCPECHNESKRRKRGWKRANRKPSVKKVPWEN